MKTICSSVRGVIQVRRPGYIAFYTPTKSSRKRFVRIALNDWHVQEYKTFRVLSSASFCDDIWQQVYNINLRVGGGASHRFHTPAQSVATTEPATITEVTHALEIENIRNSSINEERTSDSASIVISAPAMPDEGDKKSPASSAEPAAKFTQGE